MPVADRLPVLWLSGAPGVGKSATAWHLFTDLARTPAAYVDIDQLGMLFPAPEGDPDHDLTKARNLAAVVRGYAGVGAERLVVSGVMARDAVEVVREVVGEVAELRICQLRVEGATLRRRLEQRGWSEDVVERALEEQRELGRAELDARLDVAGESVAEVADLLRPLLPESRAVAAGGAEVVRPAAGVPVAVVTGPRAVGKSTVAWELFRRRVAAGRRTVFLDLEQLGFAHVSDEARARLRVRNAIAVAQVSGGLGAREVIVNGGVGDELAMLRELADVHVVTLAATPDVIAERVKARAAGGGPQLAGDDLLGADEAAQAEVVRRSLDEAGRYAEGSLGGVTVETSDKSVAEVADEVEALLGG